MHEIYHPFDTTLFTVFPKKEEGKICTYGKFQVKWSTEKYVDPYGRNYGYAYGRNTSQQYIAQGWISMDHGLTWEKYDHWQWRMKYPKEAEKFEKEVRKDFDLRRKERNKRLAAERREANAAEAKKRGISVEDLMVEKKDERQLVKEERKIEKRVEYTNRLLKAGPTIRILHDDLADLLKRIENGEQLKLGYLETGIRRLEEAKEVVARWRKTYDR